jgi:hypothetical protein
VFKYGRGQHVANYKIVIASVISSVIGGTVVAAIALYALTQSPAYQAMQPDLYGAGKGHEALTNFRCRYGETKHVLMNGKDDNFVLDDTEPGHRSPRLNHLPGHLANFEFTRNYDETGMDKVLIDYFELPKNIVSGIFATRFEEFEDYGSDFISLGDFAYATKSNLGTSWGEFTIPIANIDDDKLAKPLRGGIYVRELKDLVFRSRLERIETEIAPYREYKSLLEYVRARDTPIIIEVMVADDTAVDFTGIAVCTAPAESRGLTYVSRKYVPHSKDKFQTLGCDIDTAFKACNPFYGDTACSESLPVACFKDNAEPMPEISSGTSFLKKNDWASFWSGGEMAFTPAAAGNQFETVAEVNQYCAATFGGGWRVLNYHDGGVRTVSGRRSLNVAQGRVWVDIRDQPNATCWARSEGSVGHSDQP